jgi:hypothetical protein
LQVLGGVCLALHGQIVALWAVRFQWGLLAAPGAYAGTPTIDLLTFGSRCRFVSAFIAAALREVN